MKWGKGESLFMPIYQQSRKLFCGGLFTWSALDISVVANVTGLSK